MHNPESVLENETHKLLWHFEIQMDHLISARRQDLVIINRKKGTCRTVDLAVLADHRVKSKENRKKDKYLDLARKLKNWHMKVTAIPIVTGALGTVNKGFINKRTSGDHPNYSIIENGQNTKMNPGDLRSEKPSANAGVYYYDHYYSLLRVFHTSVS